MNRTSRKSGSQPDAMTDLARGVGGGDDAASALALRLVESAAPDYAAIDADMARRLEAALGGDSHGCASLKLGLSAEAIRQACRSGRPTARFLRKVCLAYGINGHWLLTGQGEPHLSEPASAPSPDTLDPVRTPPEESHARESEPASSMNADGYEWL